MVTAGATEGEEGNRSHETKRNPMPFAIPPAPLNLSRGDQPRGCGNRSAEGSCLPCVRCLGGGEAHEEGNKEGTEGRNRKGETVQRKAMGLCLADFKGVGGDGVAGGGSVRLEGVHGQESLHCLE